MKKKILAIMLASSLTMGVTIPAFATPDSQQLSETRQKYAEIENKISEQEKTLKKLKIPP